MNSNKEDIAWETPIQKQYVKKIVSYYDTLKSIEQFESEALELANSGVSQPQRPKKSKKMGDDAFSKTQQSDFYNDDQMRKTKLDELMSLMQEELEKVGETPTKVQNSPDTVLRELGESFMPRRTSPKRYEKKSERKARTLHFPKAGSYYESDPIKYQKYGKGKENAGVEYLSNTSDKLYPLDSSPKYVDNPEDAARYEFHLRKSKEIRRLQYSSRNKSRSISMSKKKKQEEASLKKKRKKSKNKKLRFKAKSPKNKMKKKKKSKVGEDDKELSFEENETLCFENSVIRANFEESQKSNDQEKNDLDDNQEAVDRDINDLNTDPTTPINQNSLNDLEIVSLKNEEFDLQKIDEEQEQDTSNDQSQLLQEVVQFEVKESEEVIIKMSQNLLHFATLIASSISTTNDSDSDKRGPKNSFTLKVHDGGEYKGTISGRQTLLIPDLEQPLHQSSFIEEGEEGRHIRIFYLGDFEHIQLYSRLHSLLIEKNSSQKKEKEGGESIDNNNNNSNTKSPAQDRHTPESNKQIERYLDSIEKLLKERSASPSTKTLKKQQPQKKKAKISPKRQRRSSRRSRRMTRRPSIDSTLTVEEVSEVLARKEIRFLKNLEPMRVSQSIKRRKEDIKNGRSGSRSMISSLPRNPRSRNSRKNKKVTVSRSKKIRKNNQINFNSTYTYNTVTNTTNPQYHYQSNQSNNQKFSKTQKFDPKIFNETQNFEQESETFDIEHGSYIQISRQGDDQTTKQGDEINDQHFSAEKQISGEEIEAKKRCDTERKENLISEETIHPLKSAYSNSLGNLNALGGVEGSELDQARLQIETEVSKISKNFGFSNFLECYQDLEVLEGKK